jgi:hypothetical protein
MNERELRSFLIVGEKPARVVVTTDEGRQEVGVARNGVSWAQIAKTILSLSPTLVECFNAQDQLLRAHRFDDSPKGPEGAFATPALIAGDPETQRLTHFANLLAQAYQFSIGKAFDKFVELADKQDARLATIEARLERTDAENRRLLRDMIRSELEEVEALREEAEQAAAAAASPENIASAFLTNMAVGAAQKNGASKP